MASPAKKYGTKIIGMRVRKTMIPNDRTAKRQRFEEMVKLIKPKGDDHASDA